VSAPPLFSVIIATYNRPAQLNRCLAALAQIAPPLGGFETVVIDDGGHEALEAILAPYWEPLDLTLIQQLNAGPAAARNTGIAAARGAFAAFVDDDCIPPPAWLTQLENHVTAYPEVMVGGQVVNALTDNPFSAFSQQIVAIVYAHYNADPLDAQFLASNNMVVPLAGLRALGGFTMTMRNSEDRDLCDRWRFSGRQIHYMPDITMLHGHALTLDTFIRQHLSYGLGAHDFHNARAARGSGTMLEAARFHANLDNWLINPLRGAQGLVGKARVLALIALWQGTNMLGYALRRFGRRA